MPATTLSYLHDEAIQAPAGVLRVEHGDDGMMAVVTDHTLFYPQGGGQPCDTGTITNGNTTLDVVKVTLQDQEVLHWGTFRGGAFEAGETVTLHVDADRRQVHSMLHTAGHLVDAAMANLGLKMKPGRGYHFPDGSYVEYEGIVEPERREALKASLTNELNRLAASALEVSAADYPPAALPSVCMHMPAALPDAELVRVVFIGGKYGCACGGTHVSNTRELPGMEVYKIKCKNGCTRVSYKLIHHHV